MPQPAIVTDIYQGRARVTFSPGRHTYVVRVPNVVEKLWQPSVTGVLQSKGKPALINWAAKKSLEYVKHKLGAWESTQGEPPFMVNSQDIYSWIAEAEEGWNEMTEASIGTLAHKVFEAELKFRAGQGPKPRLPIESDPIAFPNFTPIMLEAANASAYAGLKFINDHQIEPMFLERVLWSPSTGDIGTTDFVGKIDGKFCIGDWKTSKRIFPEYRIQLAKYTQMYYEEFKKLALHRIAINTKKDGGLEHEWYDVDSYQFDLDAYAACRTLYDFNREHDKYAKGTPVQVLGDLDLRVARPK